jgi:hypothetical protein
MDDLLASRFFNPDLTTDYYEHLRRYAPGRDAEKPEVGDIVRGAYRDCPACEPEHVVEQVEAGYRDYAGMTQILVKGSTCRAIWYDDPRQWKLVRRAAKPDGAAQPRSFE